MINWETYFHFHFVFWFGGLDQTFGNNEQTCMVSTINLPGVNETTTFGCLPSSAPESSCGTRVTIDGKTTSMCCCNTTDNCNNNLFAAQCRNGTAPTSKPPGFQCYNKADDVSSVVECSSKSDCIIQCKLYFSP